MQYNAHVKWRASYSGLTTEADLKEAFEAHGAVQSAAIIKDKLTGDSRDFGFVEMPNKEEEG